MKKNILLLFMFVLSIGLNAQSRYLWTAAINNNWKNAGNWALVDGPGVSGAYPKDITCIALFGTSAYGTSANDSCNIDGYYYPNGGLYVGGVEVNGYTGTITQMPGNRFLITDCPSMNGCAYNSVYKAVFNFGAGGKFVGSTLINVAGSLNYQDNYTMAIGVKLEIISGDFYCPRKLLMENSCDIAPGCFRGEGFDGSGCVVSFYPRPTGLMSTYFINANNVDFYDLQLYTGKYLDFGAGNMNITNDLITAGSTVMHINNGTFHIKNNIVINSGDYSTYSLGTAHNPAGTAMLIMDGTIAQKIIKNTNPTNETSGPLGHVTINNSNGVSVTGRVNIAGSMTFIAGIITQQTPGAPDDVLIFDNPAVVIGANDNSYSEAPVRKHIYSLPTASFEFPVGKNGEYHPIIISAPTGGATGYGSTFSGYYTQFTAEYFDTPTPFASSTGPGVFAVHDCQYWTLQRNNKPGSNAKVSLTWNSQTCNFPYFASTTNLRVTNYNTSTSQWENLGVSGLSAGQISEATGTPLTQFDAANPTMFTFCQSANPLVATISSYTNVTCNGGNDGTATVTTTGEIGTLTYSWSTVPVQTTATATGLTAGTYTVTVNSSSGQVATTTVTIFEPVATTILLPFLPPICSTSLPVLLNTNPGGVWSGGPYITFSSGNYYFDPSISGVGSFPMTYTETSASGCVNSGSTTVDVILGPARPLGWEWAKEPDDIGESNGQDIVVDPISGNVYTVGNFKGTIQFGATILTSAGGYDVYIVCHDNSGNILWAKSYGGASDDNSYGISNTGTNLTISGFFFGTTNFDGINLTSNGVSDFFVAQLDPASGNVLWANSAGGTNRDEAHGVVSNANYTYITGFIDYNGAPSINFGSGVIVTGTYFTSFVAQYDNATGNCLWATPGTVIGQLGSVVMINANGDIVSGGYHRDPFTSLPANYYLASHNSSGTLLNFNFIQAAMHGGSDYSGLGGIDHDAAGIIYISGVYSDLYGPSEARFNSSSMLTPSYTTTPSGPVLSGARNEIFWAKYDDQLNLIAQKNIGAGNAYFAGSSLVQDNAGNSYITAGFDGVISNLCYSIPSYGYDDVFVMKLDFNGDFIWAQKPDGGYFEAVSDIALDASGNVFITGFMFGSAMNFGTINLTINNSYYGSAYTAKLSPTGSSVYREGGETISASENKSESLKAYPNPSNGSFTIETKSTAAKDIFVYDVMGKIVFTATQNSDSTISIDITDQPAGIYFVKVVTGNSIETKRMIKQ